LYVIIDNTEVMPKHAIFVFSGNCRTFINCVDSVYTHIISKLFSNKFTIYIYLYLKLSDPGPKGKDGWNFTYKDVTDSMIVNKINELKRKYSTLNIEYTLLAGDEISDTELMAQVKDRTLYTGGYIKDNILIRGLHCHYNFEKCGNYIVEKEKSIQCTFDYIIYIRPDLFFDKSCDNIQTYSKTIITLGIGPNEYNNDHIAIIPRQHLDAFFFGRINLYRHNTQHQMKSPEMVYWHTIIYEVKPIGHYYIKR